MRAIYSSARLALVAFLLTAASLAQIGQVAHTGAVASPSAAINTTGASAIVVVCYAGSDLSSSLPTDSASNTWVGYTEFTYPTSSFSEVWGRPYVSYGPTTSASHTFTCPYSAGITVDAISGTGTTSGAFDGEATSGSLTPSQPNDIAIEAAGADTYYSGTACSVSSPWTATNAIGGSAQGTREVMAYYVDSGTSAVSMAYNCPSALQTGNSLLLLKQAGSGVATPTVDNGTGTYYNAVTVTPSDGTAGWVGCYTLNGDTPTASVAGTCDSDSGNEHTLSTTISITATGTVLKILGTKSGLSNSAVATFTYTLQVGAVSASPVAGTYTGAQSVSLSVATTTGATIHYRTDGTAAGCGDTAYSGAIPIASGTVTVTAVGCETGFANSAGFSGTYVIAAPTPTLSLATGTYNNNQSLTMSASGATICYTKNGDTPTAAITGTCDADGGNEFTYSSAITVSQSETVKAIGTVSGDTNSGVASATYTMVVLSPTFSPAAGAYVTLPSVTVSDGTTGAAISYCIDTANSCTPSTTYSAAVAIPAWNDYLRASASLAGYTASGVASARYTQIPVVATPTLTPGTGSYNATQTVTASTATSGATVCVGVNMTPTASVAGTCDSASGESSVTNGRTFSVAASETVSAIATLAGDTNSAVATAVYTLQMAAPSASPAQGAYPNPLTVTLADTGATILYTTDGSTPACPSTGTAYSAPFAISTSGAVTVRAIGCGSLPGSVVTSTAYLVWAQAETDTGSRAPCTTGCGNGGALGPNWTQWDGIAPLNPGFKGTATTAVSSVAMWTAQTFNPDQASQMNCVNADGNDVNTAICGVVVRGSGSSAATFTGYMLWTYSATNSQKPTYWVDELDAYSGGAKTLLWSTTQYYVTGVFSLSAQGTTITAYDGGTVLFSATDSTVASGSPGFLSSANTYGSATLYDGTWSGYNLGTLVAPTVSPTSGAYATLPTVTVTDPVTSATFQSCSNVGSACTPSGSSTSFPLTVSDTYVCAQMSEAGVNSSPSVCGLYTLAGAGVNNNIYVWILQ